MGSFDGKDRAGLGFRLEIAREACEMDQGTAARKIGKSQSWLSMVESGQRSVNAELLWSLAELYGCSVGYFFGEVRNSKADTMHRATLETIRRLATWSLAR